MARAPLGHTPPHNLLVPIPSISKVVWIKIGVEPVPVPALALTIFHKGVDISRYPEAQEK